MNLLSTLQNTFVLQCNWEFPSFSVWNTHKFHFRIAQFGLLDGLFNNYFLWISSFSFFIFHVPSSVKIRNSSASYLFMIICTSGIFWYSQGNNNSYLILSMVIFYGIKMKIQFSVHFFSLSSRTWRKNIQIVKHIRRVYISKWTTIFK